MRATVTVVGLGPSGEDLLPAANRELITSAPVAFLRTRHHPSAAALAAIPSFDHHYEDAASFDEVYRRIVEDLVAAAEVAATAGDAVVYGVPGSPLVAERTVELLRHDSRVQLSVVPALSFLDLAWQRLGVDPVDAGVRLVDGTRFAEHAAGQDGPLVVAQCWSQSVLSEIKLAAEEAVPEAVTVLHHLGLPDEVVVRVPWPELDRAVVPDHLTSVWVPSFGAGVGRELVAVDELVRRLRADCPWDRQQTHESLTRHLLEESYEVIDALHAFAEAHRVADHARDVDPVVVDAVEEELGDLLFQVFFHARLAAERGEFTIADVARALREKLVGRHPHVFGDAVAPDAASVLASWEEHKKKEKGRRSVTEGVPSALPALALAAALSTRAASVPGFEPEDLEQARAGVAAALSGFGTDAGLQRAGALLWSVAALVQRAGVDPEGALRIAALGFKDRVRRAEELASASSDERHPGG